MTSANRDRLDALGYQRVVCVFLEFCCGCHYRLVCSCRIRRRPRSLPMSAYPPSQPFGLSDSRSWVVVLIIIQHPISPNSFKDLLKPRNDFIELPRMHIHHLGAPLGPHILRAVCEIRGVTTIHLDSHFFDEVVLLINHAPLVGLKNPIFVFALPLHDLFWDCLKQTAVQEGYAAVWMVLCECVAAV
jgi:hypothetical protein